MKCPICGKLKVPTPHDWECNCSDLDYINLINTYKKKYNDVVLENITLRRKKK